MPDYRRYFTPGSMCFFTVNLKNRKSRLLVDRVEDLRIAWRKAGEERPFQTITVCILPDHLHCVLKLPDGDADFPIRWMLIKTLFTRAIPKISAPSEGARPRERGVVTSLLGSHDTNDLNFSNTSTI